MRGTSDVLEDPEEAASTSGDALCNAPFELTARVGRDGTEGSGVFLGGAAGEARVHIAG